MPPLLPTKLAIVLALILLDVRDLWVKCVWFGTSGSVPSTITLTEPLTLHTLLPRQPLVNATSGQSLTDVPVEPTRLPSAWLSFFEKCDSLEAIYDSQRRPKRGIVYTLLHNCCMSGSSAAPMGSEVYVARSLVASSSERPDSMAWTACQLLYWHRRPPICYDAVVSDFLQRYGYASTPSLAFSPDSLIPRDWLAIPMSDAEAELFTLLKVISQSTPMSSLVCVEAFELDSAMNHSKASASSLLHAQLFGCASPTRYSTAFVGHHATGFAKLHRNRAWLTMQHLDLWGLPWVLRMNADSMFAVVQDLERSQSIGSGSLDGWRLTHELQATMSASGALYQLLLAVDLVLLVLHTWSAVELLQVRELDNSSSKRIPSLVRTTGVFAVSLYRSHYVMALTVASHLLAWPLMHTSAAILPWTNALGTHLHVFLTVVRLWALVLLLCRTLWWAVVFLSEASAYAILKHTYVAPLELMVITALSAITMRDRLAGSHEDLLTRDHQRFVDASTFIGRVLLSNAFHANEQDQFHPVAGADHVQLLHWYMPLAQILLLAVTCTIVLVVLRYGYYRRHRRAKPIAVVAAVAPTATASTGPSSASTTQYARLPAEELLGIPIRALQLVRTGLALENTQSGQRLLLAEHYVEHGVFLEAGRFLRTRFGFGSHLLRTKLGIDGAHDVVVPGEDTVSAGSPAKLRRMSLHEPRLR